MHPALCPAVWAKAAEIQQLEREKHRKPNTRLGEHNVKVEFNYIYIYRLKAGGSPELRGTLSLDELRGTLSLDARPERSFLYTDGGGCGGVGGGVITSCEVRWMMLNPGRCCLVGRCCYVDSFVVVYRRGGGGGVITSCEVRWMMLNPGRCCLVGRCCYVENQWCSRSCQLLQTAFVDMKMKKVRSSFRPLFSSALSHVLLLNRTTKIKETALQMVSRFHTSLVIHGRCKIFLFQHGQTSSSSAMKMEVRLIKPFQRNT